MEKLIENLVHEEIENLLNESLTDIVYHFTDLPLAYEIVKNNTMLMSAILDKDERRSNDLKYNYYISFTRQKHGKLGYSFGKGVRITFDGRKLSQKYKAKAYDFFTGDKGRNFRNKYREMDENEDRLYSNTPAIENVNKYILSMDVIANTRADVSFIQDMQKIATFPIHIYTLKKDFNIQNKNYTEDVSNLFMTKVEKAYPIREKDDGTAIQCLFRMFKFFIGYFEYKNIQINKESFITFYLEKYGISKYKNIILKELRKEISDYVAFKNFTSYFPTLRYDNPKLYIKITKIFMSLMRKTNKYSIKELIYDE